MQHTDSTQPRVARNDFYHPDERGFLADIGDASVRLAGAFLAGILIGWAIEAVFIAINAPMAG